MAAFSARIDEMLTEYHVLSLSTGSGDQHWAAPLFYVFDPRKPRLLFATDLTTRHGALLERHAEAVATVSNQDDEIADLHGLQMRGVASRLGAPGLDAAAELYRRTFPVPAHLTLVLWEFLPSYIKATDNRVRFGYKEEWPAP
jgi:uncharacterized protein YhbP (UPF0306 family)